jgi:hypothetical protein
MHVLCSHANTTQVADKLVGISCFWSEHCMSTCLKSQQTFGGLNANIAMLNKKRCICKYPKDPNTAHVELTTPMWLLHYKKNICWNLYLVY